MLWSYAQIVLQLGSRHTYLQSSHWCLETIGHPNHSLFHCFFFAGDIASFGFPNSETTPCPCPNDPCLSFRCVYPLAFCFELHLVGGFNPSEKYEFVSWDDEIPNIQKNHKCSKPPISHFGEFFKYHPKSKQINQSSFPRPPFSAQLPADGSLLP